MGWKMLERVAKQFAARPTRYEPHIGYHLPDISDGPRMSDGNKALSMMVIDGRFLFRHTARKEIKWANMIFEELRAQLVQHRSRSESRIHP